MKNNIVYKIKLSIGICLSIFLFSCTIAEANVSFDRLPQDIVLNDFVVGPGKIDIEMSPGESTSFELSVTNRLGTDKTFYVSEEDFMGSTDPSRTVVLLGSDRGPYSLKDFVTTATTTVDIPHATKARIKISVSIPKDAQPGGLYGSVIVGVVSKGDDNKNLSGVNTTNPIITRIGTLIFVRVKGQVKENGYLTGFSLAGNKKILTETKSVFFNLLFKNDGNIHLNPKGSIDIKNILGSSVGTIEVEPWFAMPNSLRFREVEWKARFLFGRYTANADIQRGYGDLSDQKVLVFWVIPWKVIVVVILILLFVVTAIKFVFSRFKISRK